MNSLPTPQFRLTRFRESYAIAEVDAFLDAIGPWLTGRLPNQEAASRIRDARFSPVRMRAGYVMDDVDDHLGELLKLASQGLPSA